MKYLTPLFVLLLIAFSSNLNAQTQVNGYYKSNGTYVQPHYRSNANTTTLDNWSTKGNVNPYTGKKGTKSPSYNTYTYPKSTTTTTKRKSIWDY